jgi:DNA-binding transcriptional LysR family regulator
MDRLESMSVFVAAVEAGSLSAAGRRLGIPLTTVSRKLSDLEARLKTRLLTRSTRQLGLTDTGRAYYESSKRILEGVAEAERAASGEYSAPRGELILTAPIVFGRLHVLPVVTEFLKAYPEIDIRLFLADSFVDLLESQIDLALRIGELPDSNLIATRVGEIRRVVCASPAYLADRGVPQSPADLSAHDCITFQGLTSPKTWSFNAPGFAASVPIHSRLVVNTAEAAIDAAVAGLGITRVLSYQIVASVRGERLSTILETFEPQPWPVSLLHTGQGLVPLKLRAFLDFAAPRLKARLAAV